MRKKEKKKKQQKKNHNKNQKLLLSECTYYQKYKSIQQTTFILSKPFGEYYQHFILLSFNNLAIIQRNLAVTV